MKTKGLRRLFATLLSVAALASCSPSAYVMYMETRQPSNAGLDLYGKSLALVYLESEDGRDSLMSNRISDALALNLEEDLFNGAEAVSVFKLPKNEGGDYSSKDTLANYVMSLDHDVVMILDTPTRAGAAGQTYCQNKLYVYDSMWAGDDVVILNTTYKDSDSEYDSRALKVGASLAEPLRSKWKEEMFTFVYFDSFDSSWISALEYADAGEWDKAIEKWMKLASGSRSSIERACAMYDISMACYLLEEYGLAEEWLDNADKNYPITLSQGMRKRINIALGKEI